MDNVPSWLCIQGGSNRAPSKEKWTGNKYVYTSTEQANNWISAHYFKKALGRELHKVKHPPPNLYSLGLLNPHPPKSQDPQIDSQHTADFTNKQTIHVRR